MKHARQSTSCCFLFLMAVTFAGKNIGAYAQQAGLIYPGIETFRLSGDESLLKIEEDKSWVVYVVTGSWTGNSVKTVGKWSPGPASLSQIDIDCNKKRHRVRFTELYSQWMLQGGVRRPATSSLENEWLDAKETSFGRKLIESTCTRTPDAS